MPGATAARAFDAGPRPRAPVMVMAPDVMPITHRLQRRRARNGSPLIRRLPLSLRRFHFDARHFVTFVMVRDSTYPLCAAKETRLSADRRRGPRVGGRRAALV